MLIEIRIFFRVPKFRMLSEEREVVLSAMLSVISRLQVIIRPEIVELGCRTGEIDVHSSQRYIFHSIHRPLNH
jgi:hypothetical protein